MPDELTFNDPYGDPLAVFRVYDVSDGSHVFIDAELDDGELELSRDEAIRLRDWLIAVLANP